jgi:pSer/pThr/pTyr-binding forkhead associated (FHA) protein
MPATEGSKIAPAALKVSTGSTPANRRDFRFQQSFRIGRSETCDITINDDYVSRNHAEVAFENGKWWVRDLGSSNGIYAQGKRHTEIPVEKSLTIRLGVYGPEVVFEVEQLPPPPKAETRVPLADTDVVMAQYIQRYFAKPGVNDGAGQHTMYVRQAFQHVQTKQKRKYGQIIAALLAVVLVVAAFGLYEHRQVTKQRAMAEGLFYCKRRTHRRRYEQCSGSGGDPKVPPAASGYGERLRPLSGYTPRLQPQNDRARQARDARGPHLRRMRAGHACRLQAGG